MKTKIKGTNKKNIKKWIAAIAFVFVWASCGQAAMAADITAQKMIELTNESRQESGVPPLIISDKLTAAAEAKASDMFKFQYFDHNSPSGVTPWYWIKSAGYNYLYAGENLAIDFITAEGTHMALMRSVSHRDNILKPNYTEIGIAVRKGIFDGNESVIIVEEFGAPLKKENQADNIKGEADDFLRTNGQNKNTETEEIVTAEKNELVEIKSPVVYFEDKDYQENKNGSENTEPDREETKDEKIITEEVVADKTGEETKTEEEKKKLILPILFPVDNVKPLDEVYTEDIFWSNYEERNDRGIISRIMSIFNYNSIMNFIY